MQIFAEQLKILNILKANKMEKTTAEIIQKFEKDLIELIADVEKATNLRVADIRYCLDSRGEPFLEVQYSSKRGKRI